MEKCYLTSQFVQNIYVNITSLVVTDSSLFSLSGGDMYILCRLSLNFQF